MSKKIFTTVPRAKVKKSVFDLSHERKLSGPMGKLIPILCQEVVPGDKFRIDTQSMIRLAPLVSPVMHRMNSYIHYFYVPSRILMPNGEWEKFITGKTDEVPFVPKAPLGQVSIGSLADHLGFPTGDWNSNQAEYINVLPFRAYHSIYNEYYRDQNLEDPIDFMDPQFNDAILSAPLLTRAWEKDYFTSAFKTAQLGDPISVNANVSYLSASKVYNEDENTPEILEGLQGRGVSEAYKLQGSTSGKYKRLENIEEVSVDVQEIRLAEKLQRFLERQLRTGSRYVEHLLGTWGVYPNDARLQRPEYIGGGKTPVVISEVLNTAAAPDPETEGLPVGEMAGHGISVGVTNQASKYCEEHGYIMGILSVIPEPAYYQGLHKMFTRLSYLDFYFPDFAHLGEQEIKNKELYMSDNDTQNNATWGYQSRWAEYKYCPSTVHGDFKLSLDHWHMARKFDALPPLNNDFIKCHPTTRIFAVENQKEHMYIQLYHRIIAVRPMPFFNNPSII